MILTTVHASSYRILLSFLFIGLGSCAQFHTSISREIASVNYKPQAQEVVRPSSLDDSQNKEAIIQEISDSGRFSLEWPVDSARLTRGFLPHKKRPHLGVDLAAPKGTPVLSAQNGMVIYAGRDFRGYGRMVLVESGNGIATLYAHFDRIYVTEGQRVHSGEILGAMGRSGRATGVHLHFEVRKDKGPIDPLPLLPGGTRIAKLIQ